MALDPNEKQLPKIIAKAIKGADKSYFFENYEKQAKAVIKALQSSGYAVVPRRATEEMQQYAADNMKAGKVRPSEHVAHVYKCMIEFAARQS